jgi:GNAT superfamily N-acetyltransferase
MSEKETVPGPQMKRVSIRPAAMDDAEAIAILTVELGYPTTVSDTKSRLSALLAVPDYFIAVAEADGLVVGWVAGEVRTSLEFEPRIEIVGLVVASTHRRSGIGKALVGAVEAWQSERGISTIFVRSNVTRPDSHAFYESIGYGRHKTQHAYIKRLE